MSKIIKSYSHDYRLQHVIMTDDGKSYLVSSIDAGSLDGFETMVFPFDSVNDCVSDWLEIYCDRYNTEEHMELSHFDICQNFESIRRTYM